MAKYATMRLFDAAHGKEKRRERVMGVRSTRITVEQETIMVVRHAKAERSWCPLCGAEVDVITLGDEGLAEVLTAKETHGSIAAGKLHLLQEAEGTARICLSSFLRCFEPAAQSKKFEKETLRKPK